MSQIHENLERRPESDYLLVLALVPSLGGLPTFPVDPLSAPSPSGLSEPRHARLDDVDALIALETAAFATDRLSRRSLRRLIARPSALCLIVEAERRLVGYVLVLFRRTAHVARLYSIAVAPDWRGRGVGERLMAAAEREARARGCRALRLEMREDNSAAAALYRGRGYRPFGRHADYYADHGPALILEKQLDEDRAQ